MSSPRFFVRTHQVIADYVAVPSKSTKGISFFVPAGFHIIHEVIDSEDDKAPIRLRLTLKSAEKWARRLERKASHV